MNESDYKDLSAKLIGEFHWGETMRQLYATDASAYRELPVAVALPKTRDDLIQLIKFANKHRTSLIPRTAGTSLAGQVVGEGIIVDVSKYFNQVKEINSEENWVIVEPGVIRDDLNRALFSYGKFFPPETSTSNRAMIGGMIGNNSCGANSIVYGSTREHLLEVTALLSDGSEVVFKAQTEEEFRNKCEGSSLESQLYQSIFKELSNKETVESIHSEFPNPEIHRRNTGYAVDQLAIMKPINPNGENFNFCKLIAGSEGTLVFITAAKLKLTPLPPKEQLLICPHFDSIEEALKANLIAMKHQPSACELMDHYILDCTRDNKAQEANRFFVEGNPKAILIVELRDDSLSVLESKAEDLIHEFKDLGLGYTCPVVNAKDASRVWELRKAGLGLLSNIKGDAKPVPVVEDTAVDVRDLPEYIREFNLLMKSHDLFCVHYAHAGAGELHLRPILDLKTAKGQELFRTVLREVAELVKKYKGSLSGEHGDGRLRGEFIPFMIGEFNYKLLQRIKKVWDPDNILNPGKITDTPPMNSSLRYKKDQKTKPLKTILDFSRNDGILRAAEQCNGSGDCRKSVLAGGTMCPSYRATRDEKDTTRARANILREILTHSKKENPFDSEEIKEVMDLCISCKGCKTECPSSVDVTKLKQEFLYQYQKANGVTRRTRLIAGMEDSYRKALRFSSTFNFFLTNSFSARLIKQFLGFAPQRKLPQVNSESLFNWLEVYKQTITEPKKTVFLFIDEFTNLMDLKVGQDSVYLLNKLGYEVQWIQNSPSGRTYLSKGLLEEARELAQQNISSYHPLINQDSPLIGLEPSAILSFRDEYIDLSGDLRSEAVQLAQHCYTIEEFIFNEVSEGQLDANLFHTNTVKIRLHGHCFQKALSSTSQTKNILELPDNYSVHEIPSGCCGMAGSFGYEKEHYEVSMNIGEQTLFPDIRSHIEEVICAPGFSCRHQINEGTGAVAFHPSTLLLQALK